MEKAKTGKLKHSNLKKTKYPYFSASPTGLLTYRRSHDGRSIKIPTGTTKISEARRIVDEELPKKLGINPEDARVKRQGVRNPAIESVWEKCVDERKAIVSDETLVKYDVAWRNHIEPFWGDQNISDLTEPNIRSWESWFMRNKPGRVFFNTRKYFGMLVRFAHKRGHISQAFEITDLDKFIASKTKREKVGRVYNPEELSRMVECGCSEVAVLGILLGSKMGMRIGEFLSIEWNRIDFKKNCIEVWSKNKHWRTIPMTKDVAEYLKIRRKSFPDAKLVFGASRTPSKPMAKQVFYKYWVEMLLAAGIKGRARVHDLRHTFATKTARDNWPPTVACKLLDMSLQQYMKTYVHITYDDMVSLMQKSFGGNA